MKQRVQLLGIRITWKAYETRGLLRFTIRVWLRQVQICRVLAKVSELQEIGVLLCQGNPSEN